MWANDFGISEKILADAGLNDEETTAFPEGKLNKIIVSNYPPGPDGCNGVADRRRWNAGRGGRCGGEPHQEVQRRMFPP